MSIPKPDIRVVIIAGPTGVGKTELALRIAEIWKGEIISADSMQVYRYMDIGTAKPSKAERAAIPYHLIDVVNPDEPFNASMYVNLARKAIEAADGNKTFLVVGGTGLYIKALLGGIFSAPGADEGLREYYRHQLRDFGGEYLYRTLKDKDEKAAGAIMRNDAVRIIRALEVLELTGKSIMEQHQEHRFQDRPYNYLKIGLMMEREQLFERIERRAEGMIIRGFIEEVRWLMEHGYHEGLKSMQSLGYRHMARFLRDRGNLEESLYLMKRDTRRYAKRQITWFKADREIYPFRYDDVSSIMEKIKGFMA
ncbi:MAG TPA: tRNA (adenosine(37)-N6)-dimethylallyltransferase MiaA [Syntrophales bacterium]|nr:tRNA (adenosine(37)-N6)-dimethylallyltransferase MiaA [Syntrophales bacterium]